MVSFAAGLLNATVQAATVLLLAGLGELISERAGVLNLGVEGMMLVGALGGFVVTAVTGNYWLGFGVGIACGMALAAVHAFLCISLKSNQVISGVMLTLLGTGLTTFFGSGWVQESITGFPQMTFPIVGRYLVHLPLVGEAFFRSTATDYLALLAVPVVWFFLYRSNLGLEIIAVGEDPEMADTMGVPVFKFRYLAVIIGGGFAGAAGAHLSLAFSQLWVPGMTVGRGWIAVALVVFAQWRPSRMLVGAYLFGLLDALQLRSQSLSLALDPNAPLAGVLNPLVNTLMNPQIMSTYPYLTTIAVLSYAVIRTESVRLAVPSALLQSYNREMD
ncbi:ABC transporter permease [Haloferax volcanii]|uniref:Sugar ABC transporter permease n=2 Tax=Haloferax volcanii TaxID=2246 RepID=L9VIF5_HALVD|nr:ABC transporter permease [Haloferax volcanii]ELY36899.1 sugar ABC transporter permease [Haloferax volcanii DS2]MBS8118018.1 ABC transporter permease [Haloferax volcanii]MBS8123030.1 ABC transporter permease [Haloferax volcanii]MBS8126898.1 ABC transporter permease [Haloferax volcanii]MBS8130764.1 ABC transporter permease [Haloferax volcanii]